MGGNNEIFERNKYLKKIPSMQRVEWDREGRVALNTEHFFPLLQYWF